MRSSGWAKLLFLGALVLAVLLITRGGSPPATAADQLVPAHALLYVHVSTDPEREQDRWLVARARRIPALAPLVRALRRERPWLGDEAALFVSAEGSALVLRVRDRKGAEKAAPRLRAAHGAAAFVAGFLVAGDRRAVARAAALGQRRGRALADHSDYARRDRPAERSVDVWVSARAVSLLPRPLRLIGGRPLVASVIPSDEGVEVIATRLGGAGRTADFRPRLLRALPQDTYAYAGIRGLGAIGALPDIAAPLAEVLDGEIALSIAPGTGEPVVTLVAEVSDPAAARAALASLQGDVVAALTGSGVATGQVPVFEERRIGGQEGYALQLTGGGELVYAVAGDRVIVSSREEGVSRALRDADGLDTSRTFATVVTDLPDSVQALAFVASNQLLELADESGLDAASVYRQVRPNLARIRALGAVVRRQGNDTTAELTLIIP